MDISLSSSEQSSHDHEHFSRSFEQVIFSEDNIFNPSGCILQNSQYRQSPGRSSKNAQEIVYQIKIQTQKTDDNSKQPKDSLQQINSSQEMNNRQCQNQCTHQQNKHQLSKGKQFGNSNRLKQLKIQIEKMSKKDDFQDILYLYNDQANFKKNNFKKSMGKLFIKLVSDKIKEEDVYPPQWINRMKQVIKKYTRKDINKTHSFSNADLRQILCIDEEEFSAINFKILGEITRNRETIGNKVILTGHVSVQNTMKYMKEAKILNLRCRNTWLVKNYFDKGRS